jgi:hypothetical protein
MGYRPVNCTHNNDGICEFKPKIFGLFGRPCNMYALHDPRCDVMETPEKPKMIPPSLKKD